MFIDIGNSRVKIKKLIEGETFIFDTNKYDEILSFINVNYKDKTIYISSVVKELTDFLINNLKNKKYYFFSNSDITTLKHNAEGLGVDRLLADIGAVSIYDAAILVVDCGSAITIEYINNDKYIEGGLIIPGIKLGITSLHDYASLLPLVDYKKYLNILEKRSKIFFSNNTEDAIFYGVVLPICTCIDDFYNEINDKKLKIVISGGDGLLVQKYLKNKSYYEEDLVFKGIQSLLKKGGLL